MRVAAKITFTDEQRATLQRWARGRSTPVRRMQRAKMVLLAAEGKQNKVIAETLRVQPSTVGRWRQRFAESGLAGIAKDAPRGGRRPTKQHRWTNGDRHQLGREEAVQGAGMSRPVQAPGAAESDASVRLGVRSHVPGTRRDRAPAEGAGIKKAKP